MPVYWAPWTTALETRLTRLGKPKFRELRAAKRAQGRKSSPESQENPESEDLRATDGAQEVQGVHKEPRESPSSKHKAHGTYSEPREPNDTRLRETETT